MYDTIYIEEFDKLRGTRLQEFEENFETLLTGMEQGKWQREKSGKVVLEFKRAVGFGFMGNLPDRMLFEEALPDEELMGHRGRAYNYFAERLKVDVKAFISRMTYVEFLDRAVKALEYAIRINGKPAILNFAVGRGIIRELQNRVLEFDEILVEEKSRMHRSINNIYAITSVLTPDTLDENTIKMLARGEITFYDAITHKREGKSVSEGASEGEGEGESVSEREGGSELDREVEELENFEFDLSALLDNGEREN